MPAITPMGAQLIFNHMTGAAEWPFNAGAWLALFTSAPFDPATLTVGTEVNGGGYARQLITPAPFTADDLGMFNGPGLRFANMPGVQVAGAGIYTDAAVGTLVFYEAYPEALTVNAGQRFVVLPDSLGVLFT